MERGHGEPAADPVVPQRIALIGTRGVPARYGGFETCVEEVGSRLAAQGHEVIVYCRGGDTRVRSHKGMRLVHLPAAKRRSLETLSHTALSVGHAVLRGRPTVAIVFNAANAPFLPVLRARRVPVATHVDGLEWRRGKWSGVGQRYYRLAERMAVRWSDRLIADAQGIADYYETEFRYPTDLIAYGAPAIEADDGSSLAALGLTSRGYHLVVARFEPENHVRLIVEGYVASAARLPLVVVGGAPYAAEYTQAVHAAADDRVQFLGSLWDQELLDQLYAHCSTYLHGHSVGGTNPSLLRAMGAGAATIAYDVVFNREVLGAGALTFRSREDLRRLIEEAEDDQPGLEQLRANASERARDYDWDRVAAAYALLVARLANGPTSRRGRPRGRRFARWEELDGA